MKSKTSSARRRSAGRGGRDSGDEGENVVDLMAALKKSVAQSAARRAPAKAASKKAVLMADRLGPKYNAKRDFRRTAEPRGKVGEVPAQGGCSSRSRSTTRSGCITTCGWNGTACCCSWAVPKGPPAATGETAAGGAHRGSSARLRRVRGHDPQGRIRRRHGHAVGPGHMDAARRRRTRCSRRETSRSTCRASGCAAAGRSCDSRRAATTPG